MKRLFCFIWILFNITVFGQKPELTVQTGHSAPISEVEFSPFDDFVASAGLDHKIVLWDFFSGKQYKVLLGHHEQVTAINFHPDNQYLLSASTDSTVKVWDYLKGDIVHDLHFNYPVYDAKFDPNGEYILVAGKELVFVNFQSMEKEVLSLKPKHYFSTIEFSPIKDMLVVGGRLEPIGYLIDYSDTTVLKKFAHGIISADFNVAQNYVLISNNSGLAISYNYKNKKKKSRSSDWMLNTYNDVTSDSVHVFLADDHGDIRVLKKRKWYSHYVLKGVGGKIRSISKSNDGRYLAAGGESQSVVIWDLETKRVVKVLKGLVSRINDMAFSHNGREILVGYEDGSMRKTDLVSNQTIINKMSLNSDILSKVGTFSVVKIDTFAEDHAILQVVYKQAHLNREGIFDRVADYTIKWSFSNNELTFNKNDSLSSTSKKYIEDLKVGIYHENTFFQDISTRYSSHDSLEQTAQIKENMLVLTNSDQSEVMIESRHTDLLTAVDYNKKFSFVATAGWDGMIRFWDVKTGELLTVFGAFGDGQFVYINPDGYYFSSKNALNYIGFSFDNQVYSFEQFDIKYNRPDMVIQKLPYFDDFYEEAFKKAYDKRLDKLGLNEEDIQLSQHIPKIEILNDLTEALVDNELTIKLKCVDKHHELAKLHVYVNGVPELGRFGKSINGNKYEEELKITLNSGTNIIQVYAENNTRTSSLKQTFTFQTPPTNKRGKLYMLAIGVSEYAQSNYNLKYAAKDAQDMASIFHYQTNNKIEKVKLLQNNEVTKASIEEAKNFMSEAGVDDIVVLFVAGHGVLDDNLDYYFAPHDMDFSNPSKNGIPFSVFDEILENTKSRKKLMLIDACHSGEIDKDEVIKTFVTDDEENNQELIFRRVGTTIENLDDINTFELSKALFADMRLNNGATVISSSGGSEFAIEGDQWNNGVFTYTLLQGIVSKEADANKDRRLTVSELQNYVQKGVFEKTGGRQTPTSRVENLNYDFVIGKR
ncbi:MAG: caspase family protein [Crocinitomicaceae bacterium]